MVLIPETEVPPNSQGLDGGARGLRKALEQEEVGLTALRTPRAQKEFGTKRPGLQTTSWPQP